MGLSLPATAVLIVSTPIVLVIAEAGSVPGCTAGVESCWPSAAAATLGAWLVAALAARWLGSRLGLLAGLIQMAGMSVLFPSRGAAAEMLFCAAVAAAMAAFALGNVPGRMPLVEHRWTGWAFYAAAGASLVLGGPVGPAFILAGCLLFLLVCADSRGARFFASPVGIAVFVLMAAIRLAGPSGVAGQALGQGISLPAVTGWPGVVGLPLTLLVVFAVAMGLRQGHYATPIWRFFGCWAVGPLLLAAVGGFRSSAELGTLLAPVAVIAAAGLWGLLVWCRWNWRRSWRRSRGRRAGDR